jgi:NAD(P)-dependent dehydrogenase (short-subunit alcohol dehydrogenase family)
MVEKYNLNNKLVLIKADQILQQIRCVEAVIEAGGNPILIGSNMDKLVEGSEKIDKKYSTNTFISLIDATNEQDINKLKQTILYKFDTYPDILINDSVIEFEHHDLEKGSNIKLDERMIKTWDRIIRKELTTILLLTKIFGNQMAKTNGGVILNILSDMYLNPKLNISDSILDVNDISSIAITNGLFGLTKYIATYWNNKNVRSNSLTIGAYNEYSYLTKDRVNLINQIPIGRLADNDEFKAAIIFLVSDASSYMTGSNLVINGGRTCW